MSHARLSPSKAHRWMACPGSVREEAVYPDVSGPSGIDGTHTHTVLEHCVKADLADPMSMVGIKMKDHEGEFVVDADRAARVKVAIDYLRKRKEELMICMITPEQRVNPAFLLGRTDLSGTADVQIHAPGVLEIVDYKDGMGTVSAKDNLQLELYALGVLAGLQLPVNGNYPYETVRMTIVQPKLAIKGQPAITWVEKPVRSIIEDMGKFIVGAAATDDPNAPLLSGDHCKFCKHKGGCAALANNVMKEVGVMFQPVVTQTMDIAQQSADKDPTTMDDQQLRSIVEAAPLMRQLLEAAEKEAQRRLEAGGSIPGLKLVHGRGSRAWALPEDQMAEKLIKMGIPKSAVYETKLVSPAKVEKLTWEATKGGEKIRKQLSDRQLKTLDGEYVSKIAGKLTVAPESDSRPAVNLNAAPLFSAVEAPASESLPSWLLPQ
jgi:hypothetical protein